MRWHVLLTEHLKRRLLDPEAAIRQRLHDLRTLRAAFF
jgi:hypothetical protein